MKAHTPWSTVFAKSGNIVTRRVAGETILVPIRGSLAGMQSIYTLNDVAACVWDHLDGENNLGEALEAVLERFDADRVEAERDVMEFVGEVRAAGLIEERA